MQSITIIENISLAYKLGFDPVTNPSASPKNEELYGFKPGHEVRGQNLRVTLEYFEANQTDILSLKAKVKKSLKPWDHSFVNDQSQFRAPLVVTLENICQQMWSELFEASLLAIEVEQGSWKAQFRRELSSEQLFLKYKTRFQSIVEVHKKQVPIDLQLHLIWKGKVVKSTGLIQPWQQLKTGLREAQNAFTKLPADFFKTTNSAEFLKNTSAFLFDHFSRHANSQTAALVGVEFVDTKDAWNLSFDLPKDLSE